MERARGRPTKGLAARHLCNRNILKTASKIMDHQTLAILIKRDASRQQSAAIGWQLKKNTGKPP